MLELLCAVGFSSRRDFMIILPAVDLHNGQAVRLEQGDYGKVKVYDADPVTAAKRFIDSGATHLHVVDLDGAKGGTVENYKSIEKLASLDLFTEVGGGISDEETVRRYLDVGVDRLILGTVAIRNFDFTANMVAKYGEHIAVGVDARDGRVAVNGWLEDTGTDSFEFCQRLCSIGVKCIIYTDISRDGMLSGCNLDVYKRLNRLDTNFIASGGVTTEQEIRTLKSMNTYGAIVGKAIYEGRITLEDAIAAAK